MNKTTANQFAIFGGVPTFDDILHVGRPNIGDHDRFAARVKEIFESSWLTNNGPFVQEFEQKLAAYLDVKHCIAMCNATVGLEISARALGLTGEVFSLGNGIGSSYGSRGSWLLERHPVC